MRRALPVIVLTACTAPSAPIRPPSAPAPAAAPVVYGEDDRVEWYQVADPALRTEVRASAVAMVGWDYMTFHDDGRVELLSWETLGESFGLCEGERFIDQPTSSMCSGTLIDDDLVLTAGHCVPTLSDCASAAWVFDYLYEADGALAEVDADDVYGCADLIVAPGLGTDESVDLSIVQLDRPVVGRVPAPVALTRDALVTGTPLQLAGFPSTIPLKVSLGFVDDDPPDAVSFKASLDSFHGDSGSGVRNPRREIIGVLVDGADDYASAGTCNVVHVLDPSDAMETVMYADSAVLALCQLGYPSAALCAGEPECGDGFCTDGETSEACPSDCDGLFAVPEAWTCNPAWYDVGDDCDCACGAYDPDCNSPFLTVLNCAPDSGCRKDGTCEIPVPSAWTCGPESYDGGDDCDCDCGAPDPDCDNPQADLWGCAPGGACQPDGTCTVSFPPDWRCRYRFYDADDGCDCNCGARDPDCDKPNQQIFGCGPDSACLADGSCEVPIPEGWRCDPEHYGTSDGCDCRCGLPDPDCRPGVLVRNCEDGETCAEGLCVPDEAGPDADPEPGPEATPDLDPDPAPDTAAPPDAEAPEPNSDASDAANTPAETDTASPPTRKRDDGCHGAPIGILPALALLALRTTRRRHRGKAHT